MPTGKPLSDSSIAYLSSIAKNQIIIFDGIYSFLMSDKSSRKLGELWKPGNRLVFFESITKCWGVPSIRGGWATLLNEEDMEYFRIRSLTKVSPPNTLFAFVAEDCLVNGGVWLRSMKKSIEINRRSVCRFLQAHSNGSSIAFGDEGIFVWFDASALGIESTNPAIRIIREGGVALEAGVNYGGNWGKYTRINIACHETILDSALKRIERMIKD